jgi:phage gp29-like protein
MTRNSSTSQRQQTPTTSPKAKAPTLSPKIVRKSVTGARRDVADWNNAKRFATLAQEPKYYLLQEIYNTITEDALLSSQINNRQTQTIYAPFRMKNKAGKTDEPLTEALRNIAPLDDIIKAILNSSLFGYSLIEFSADEGGKKMTLINRKNIAPDFGRFYPDATAPYFIPYRESREYGSWILEFNADTLGDLNKTVPHVLFKKFAQSCWSELCEIFGIPPRYIKTNTTDQAMLDRAEQMMRELGAAAWFVIDTTEEFQFAQGVSTNGDVYSNLIRLCNNEISLAISGAIVGQDTENGNYSKEEVSIDILNRLIDTDRRIITAEFNSKVIPAFIKIGWLPATDSVFEFVPQEISEKTWSKIKDILPYKDIDNQWITDKFGIPVSDKTISAAGLSHCSYCRQQYNPDDDFFA